MFPLFVARLYITSRLLHAAEQQRNRVIIEQLTSDVIKQELKIKCIIKISEPKLKKKKDVTTVTTYTQMLTVGLTQELKNVI